MDQKCVVCGLIRRGHSACTGALACPEDDKWIAREGVPVSQVWVPPLCDPVWQRCVMKTGTIVAASDLSDKMRQNLLALASYEEGWNGPGSRGMNARSLSTFLKFWNQVREHSVEPELVLTPQG